MELRFCDRQHRLADLGGGLGEQVPHLAADHHLDDRVDARLAGGHRVDVRAVAHHGDGVAEAEDLVEAVGDEDQRAALVAEAAGDGEQPVHLDPAQGGGGLVHDQQPRVERDGLGDLEDLLVGDRQAQRGTARVDVDAEPGEERLGLGVHGAAVDAVCPAERLAAHEDVLGDREVREQRGLLVDHGDAGVLGLGGAVEVDLLVTEQELAGVAAVDAGDDLDQRRLAGAVLPDQRVDGPGSCLDAAGPQGDDGTERLRDVAEGEDDLAAACRHRDLRN